MDDKVKMEMENGTLADKQDDSRFPHSLSDCLPLSLEIPTPWLDQGRESDERTRNDTRNKNSNITGNQSWRSRQWMSRIMMAQLEKYRGIEIKQQQQKIHDAVTSRSRNTKSHTIFPPNETTMCFLLLFSLSNFSSAYTVFGKRFWWS